MAGPSYATLAQFNAFILATIADGIAINPTTITAQLEVSSRSFDSYLRERYQVPITGSTLGGPGVYDEELARNVCWHASYVLMSARGFNPNGLDTLIQKNYDLAMAWLKDVQSQRAGIDVLVSDVSTNAFPMVTSQPPVGWTRPE